MSSKFLYFFKEITVRRILLVIGQIWALPLLIIILVIRPIIIIRIGVLYSEYFGHYTGNVELYLCERDATINRLDKKYIDVWFNLTKVVSNKQIEKMWKQHLIILPWLLLAPVSRLISWSPWGLTHQIEPKFHDRDVLNLLGTQEPHANFSVEEETMGQGVLLEMGIPKMAKFVCLNVRDTAFHRKLDFTNYRNADVNQYMLAATELTKYGVYVVRVGKSVEKEFKSSNPKIIDYSRSEYRSDFMDVYLGAKCFFAISTSSGWDNVPGMLFRRPVVFTNMTPISQVQSWSEKALAIFKRYKLSNQEQFLSQTEIFNMVDKVFKSSAPPFEDLKLELVDNTPQEIFDVVLEMYDMLTRGVSAGSEEYERCLQSNFWTLYKDNLERNNLQYLHGKINLKIGAKFLLTAPEFLL